MKMMINEIIPIHGAANNKLLNKSSIGYASPRSIAIITPTTSMIITDTVASWYLPFTTSFGEILNSLYKGSIPDSSPTIKG